MPPLLIWELDKPACVGIDIMLAYAQSLAVIRRTGKHARAVLRRLLCYEKSSRHNSRAPPIAKGYCGAIAGSAGAVCGLLSHK